MDLKSAHRQVRSADGTTSRDIGRKSSHRRPSVDRAIATLAQQQHGVVSLEQLASVGLSAAAVQKRVEAGRLHRVHYGAYAVGYPLLPVEGRWMAAVVACGSGAVLSHRSAASLWGLCLDRQAAVDVTAPRRRGRSPVGIVAHRDGRLRVEDRTIVDGIPCTTVARTLLDLAGLVGMRQLRDAVGESEVLRVLDVEAVREVIRWGRGRRGVARLRLAIDDLHPQARSTRNPLELRFLELCRQALLPEPEVNAKVKVPGGVLEADFLWRSAGLIVETDGEQVHGTATAFQRDRHREQRLMAAGWRVTRCTWLQVTNEPADLVRRISKILYASAPTAQHPPTGRFKEI